MSTLEGRVMVLRYLTKEAPTAIVLGCGKPSLTQRWRAHASICPMTKKTWQQQLLKTVGEQLLSNDKVRETVTREVIQAVGRAAGSAASGSPKNAAKAAGASGEGSARGDVTQQLREIWEHPAVQGAVRSGLGSAKQQAQQWQGSLTGQVKRRAQERVDAQLHKRQAKGNLSPEEAAQLAQRQREREEQQMIEQVRQGLLTQAADSQQRKILQRAFESTAWLGGVREPLRYTQLMAELGGSEAQTQMAIHTALWSLAEQNVLAVLPNGEVQLLPEPVPQRE